MNFQNNHLVSLFLFLIWQLISSSSIVSSSKTCEGNSTNAGCFTAAVYEHVRIGDSWILNNPNVIQQVLYTNLGVLRHVAQLASIKGAKILVTPENAIYPTPSSRAVAINGFVVSIPPVGNQTCSNVETFQPVVNAPTFTVPTPSKIGQPPVSNDKLLLQIACLAAQSSLYLAVDVPELDICIGKPGCSEDGYNLYNSLIVYSPNGTLVAHYRKYRLFGEAAMNHPSEPEIVAFDTEIGRFGLVICFDLMFQQPLDQLVKSKQIDHLIFSTNWFDELPLLTGLAYHAGNAHRYKINMLSANMRRLAGGSFGSAIFSASEGVRIQTEFGNQNRLLLASLPIPCTRNEVAVVPKENVTEKLIYEFDATDDEPTVPLSMDTAEEMIIVDTESGLYDTSDESSSSSQARCTYFEPVPIGERVYREYSYLLQANNDMNQYHYLENKLSQYQHKHIETTSGRIERLCDGSVCCSMSWRMNPRFNFASDDYYLVALNRLRVNTAYPWYEQACAIVSYSRPANKFKLTASTQFDRVRLTGWFDSEASFPSLFSSRLQLISRRSWQFEQSNTTAQIVIKDLHQPLVFASIYTRVYSRDRV